MKFITHLALQLQETRLCESTPNVEFIGEDGALTLYGTLFQETCPKKTTGMLTGDYNSMVNH